MGDAVRIGGATLVAEGVSALLRCPYCGRERRLDTHVIDAAQGYGNRVAEQAALAGEHRLVANRYESLSRDSPLLWLLPMLASLFGAGVLYVTPSVGTLPIALFACVPLAFLVFGLARSLGHSEAGEAAPSSKVSGIRCRCCATAR